MLTRTLDQRILRAYRRLAAAREDGHAGLIATDREALDSLLDQRLRMADELK